MGDRISQVFSNFWGQLIGMLPNLTVAAFFLIFFFLIGYLLGKGFTKGLQSRWKSAIVVGYIGKALRWLFNLIGVLVALEVMGFGGIATTIATGAGISAIIVGFAFKDIAENFLAGVLLLISRPFEIGHIIEVNGFRGTVRGLEMRITHIRNLSGMDIYIPNAVIVKNAVTNYTRDGFLRLDFILGLDIPTDIEQVRTLIISFLQKQPEILQHPEADILVRGIGEFTIDIQVVFWVDVLRQKNIPPAYLGETIRSRFIWLIKDLLLREGYNLPSKIIEHKMYKKQDPLRVKMETE